VTQSGGFNYSDLFSGMGSAINTPGGTVGAGEKPEYDFPSGLDKVPESVRTWFMRSDNGQTGLNEFLRDADPKVIDEFRSAVNSGLIRPKNAAADQIIKGYGGLRAGDMAGPGGILGAMQDDMPSGLSPEYWQQANTLIGTMIDAKMKAADASGYFNGMPTVQREQMMGQLAQGWKQQFTNEFLANEQKRASQASEGLTQQQINNQNLQAMAGIMGGTVDPGTGQFKQTEEGRQFDTSQTGYINGQRTLAGEAQDWSQEKDRANAAANPRDYIYAQMLGNARGGLAGQPATNQLPGRDGQQPGMGGMPGMGQPEPGGLSQWDQMQRGAQPTAQQGFSPLASTQPPGTSGAGTMTLEGAQDGTPPQGAEQWAQMYQQAQAAQDQARQAMMGAQGGPGAGAASALSPGQGSAEMVQPYPGYQGQDGATSISPVNPTTGMRFDERTGQYTSAPLPTAQQNYDTRMAQFRQQGLPGTDGQFAQQPDGTGMNKPWMGGGVMQPQATGADGRESFQVIGGTATPLQQQQRSNALGQNPNATGMGTLQQFQAPRAGVPPQPGQTPGMPQPQQGVQGQQFTTSAFTQQLLKNRMVPQNGAIQGQGQYMTQQQMQKQVNPNKIRAQDFMRGRNSEQQGFLGTSSAAGNSDEDTMGAIKNNLPKFQAPGQGRMV